VCSARLHAKDILREWRLDTLADTVELLVSEIVTNAVRASASIALQRKNGRPPPAPRVRFWLTSDRCSVLIQVWDGAAPHAVRQEAGLDDETGRGLFLVDALSAQWGCRWPDGQGGKIVWAVCAR
jgi:hypothetical protein